MRKLPIKLLSPFALVGAGLLIGCFLYYSSIRKDLCQKPPQMHGSVVSYDKENSVILVNVQCPVSTLTNLINSNVPSSFHNGGVGPDLTQNVTAVIQQQVDNIPVLGPAMSGVTHFISKSIQENISIGTQYDITVNRDPFSISARDPNSLLVRLPINCSGTIGCRGDLAKAVQADNRDISAAATLNIGVTPHLNPDWSVAIDTALTCQWNRHPTVELMGTPQVTVDVTGQVENLLQQQINNLTPQVIGALNSSNPVKELLSKYYGDTTFPLELPGNRLNVNICPHYMGFSGVSIDNDNIKTAVLLNTDIEVAEQPITPQLRELPPLQPVIGTKTALTLPLHVSFSGIRATLDTVLKGKAFSSSTPAGDVSVEVDDTDIYESGDKLVIGLYVTTQIPDNLLNTNGWIYVIGKPCVLGNIISFTDLSFSQTLDQPFWTLVACIFESEIKTALVQGLRYDITGDIKTLQEKIDKSVEKLNEKLDFAAITVSNIGISPGRLDYAANDLVVEAFVTADVGIEIKK